MVNSFSFLQIVDAVLGVISLLLAVYCYMQKDYASGVNFAIGAIIAFLFSLLMGKLSKTNSSY